MLQRFIFITGDGVERGGGVDEPPDIQALAAYANLVQYLARAEYPAPEPTKFSPVAHELFKSAEKQIRALRHSPGSSAAWGGHVEKWGKFLPRITLVFHAVEQWEMAGCVDPSCPVHESTHSFPTRRSSDLGTSSSRERHDHVRRQSCNTAIASFARATEL